MAPVDANVWDAVVALIVGTPGIVAAVLLLRQGPKIIAIDNAVNGRRPGQPTISEDSTVSRLRDEAADAAASDLEADAAPGSADRAATSTADETP